MKKLKDLLYGISIERIVGATSISIQAVEFDSRKIKPGSLFVAQNGYNTDGHLYIDNAEQQGAVAIICEQLPKNFKAEVVYVQVEDASKALGQLSSNFYDHPSQKLKLIGITGTNGKTTVASLLYGLFEALGHPCGLISTVKMAYLNQERTATHTTPNAVEINQFLAELVNKGVTHCFMEVSSHGIAQGRIEGLTFTGGIFTNLTHEHLDYHGDFKTYRDTKKYFFDLLPPQAFALTNLDDKNGEYMLQNTKAKTLTYALKHHADYKVHLLECELTGMLLKIQGQEVWTNLVGEFNAQNLIAVYAAAELLAIPSLAILKQISLLKPTRGRFQILQTQENITIIVDYAHSPDALENVLQTINKIRTRNEKLITIVGCGGNRDKEKRPIMGNKAAALSDQVIFTSDNPRGEDPQIIIEEMIKGVAAEDFKKVLKITLREEAISVAGNMARKGDIVLIAGKGHETYQEIKGKKYPFDDFQIAQQIFTKTQY